MLGWLVGKIRMSEGPLRNTINFGSYADSQSVYVLTFISCFEKDFLRFIARKIFQYEAIESD